LMGGAFLFFMVSFLSAEDLSEGFYLKRIRSLLKKRKLEAAEKLAQEVYSENPKFANIGYILSYLKSRKGFNNESFDILEDSCRNNLISSYKKYLDSPFYQTPNNE